MHKTTDGSIRRGSMTADGLPPFARGSIAESLLNARLETLHHKEAGAEVSRSEASDLMDENHSTEVSRLRASERASTKRAAKLEKENEQLKTKLQSMFTQLGSATMEFEKTQKHQKELEKEVDKLRQLLTVRSETEMMRAARAGDACRLVSILNHNEDACSANAVLGRTLCGYLMTEVAEEDSMGIVGRLVDANADIDTSLGERGHCVCGRLGSSCHCGESPMHLAAALGSDKIIRQLARGNGAAKAINATDFDDRTPLHIAAEHGSAAVVQELLIAGADLEAVDGNGDSPADIAGEEGHEAVLGVLESPENLFSMLMRTLQLEAAAQLVERYDSIDKFPKDLRLQLWTQLATKLSHEVGSSWRVVDAATKALELSSQPEVRVAMLQLRAPAAMGLCDHAAAARDYGELEAINWFNNSQSAAQKKSWSDMRKEANALATANHYQILCVDQTASLAEIKKGYYKLSRQWHPDKHQESVTAGKDTALRSKNMFGRICAAYEVLSDSEKKEDYDQQLAKRESTRVVSASGRRSSAKSRDKCDKRWFEKAMHEPHIDIHQHSTDFDDSEFDEYLNFMRGMMNNEK